MTRREDYSNNNNFDVYNEFELPALPELTLPTTRSRNTNVARGTVRDGNTATCQQRANIIGGDVITSTLVCVVQRLRNINATILGRQTRSPLSLAICTFL